jgi:hypothetical protein
MIWSIYDAYDEKCRIALYKYSLAVVLQLRRRYFHIFTPKNSEDAIPERPVIIWSIQTNSSSLRP